MSEGLFYDNSRPFILNPVYIINQIMSAELFDNEWKITRLCREVEYAIAAGSELRIKFLKEAVELRIAAILVKFRAMVKNLLAESAPKVLINRLDP